MIYCTVHLWYSNRRNVYLPIDGHHMVSCSAPAHWSCPYSIPKAKSTGYMYCMMLISIHWRTAGFSAGSYTAAVIALILADPVANSLKHRSLCRPCHSPHCIMRQSCYPPNPHLHSPLGSRSALSMGSVGHLLLSVAATFHAKLHYRPTKMDACSLP